MPPAPDLNVPPDLAVLPGNDCLSATPLSFAGGRATVQGDTTASTDSTASAGCGGIGPDLLYAVTLNQRQRLMAILTPGDLNLDPVVYLRTDCADDTSAAEVGCDQQSAGTAAQIDVVLGPGTYFLRVDGYGGTSGPFTLDVVLQPPPPPPVNERCAGALPLLFTNGQAAATGDLRSATDDAAGTCGGAGGVDAVYSFTTAAEHSLQIDVLSRRRRPTSPWSTCEGRAPARRRPTSWPATRASWAAPA